MEKVSLCLIIIVIIFSSGQVCQAGGDMKFPIQITYVSGLSDVYDLYIDNLEEAVSYTHLTLPTNREV